ncbi:hypothetical protein GW915_02050 [bacterium]|nr:hypothetical protein [bacterium]
MMMSEIFSFQLNDVAFGVATGLVSTLGLMLGVKMIFKAQAESNKSNFFMLLGVIVLVLQFALAGYLVFLAVPTLKGPLGFGVGLMGTMLLVTIASKFFPNQS